MHGIQHTSGCRGSRRSLLIGQSDRNYSNCKLSLPLSTNLGNLGRFGINKSTKIFHALLPFLAMFALVFALSQTGAAYTLTSTSGIWTDTDGGSNINGLNTNHVKWGESTGYGQSGLIFNGVGSTSFTVGQQISLGTLTHENFPIRNAANGATLKITLKFTDPAISSIDLNYNLVIDETNNQDKCSDCYPKYTPCYSLPDHAPCSSASIPCPDKVSWSNQQPTQSFSIAGTCYTLYIDGFKDESGNVVNQFITQERCSNPATLYGHIGLSTTAVSTTTPTVCEGTSSVKFTATSASCDSATYKWYKNESTTALANGAKYSGATTSALVINNLVQSDSGTYKAVATCSAGCTAAGSATLTVNSNPVCTITAPVTVCAGVTGYKFSVPTAGTGATYTWTATSGSITAGSGTREITWTAGSAGTAKISVTVTKANGCTCSNSVTVTVGSLPSCVITAPTTICAGVTGYKFSVPSSTGATYAWTASSGTITAGSSTREITWTAGAAGSATISVTVTGSNGCVCTSSTVVTIKSQSSCVITAPTSICAGVTGYKFSVPSSTGATYAWTASSGTITAGSSTREITWTAGTAGSATISVTVTNSNGCVCSNSTTVMVTSLPSCTITTPTKVCAGVAGYKFSVPTAGSGATYSWTASSGSITAGSGTREITWTAGSAGSATISVTVTNSAGCSCSNTATVTVNALPSCVITTPPKVCAGVAGYKFSVPTAGSGATYSWTASSGTITDGSSTREITWTAGTAGSATISVTVTNSAGCSCSNTATVTVNDLPSCTITTPPKVCAGVAGYKFSVPIASAGATYSWTASSGSITAGSGTREITWTAGTAGSATISVTVTNSAGCSCSNTATVTVNDLPSCTITTPPKVCAGVAGYKFSVPTAGSGATYSWTVSSGSITAGSGTREITWTAGSASSATISVTVTNSNGCSCSNTATVTVNDLPSCTITTPAKVCAGVAGYKFSVPTAGSGATYSWTASSGTITDGSSTREITWTAGSASSATISVTVTNSNGCSCSNTATVTVNALPSCVITTPPKVCAGVAGYKFSVPTAGSGATYSWTASSGTITDGSSTREITWTAGTAGSATISVTVTNSAGCSCSNTATVTVNDLPSCTITTPPKVCAGVAGYKFSVPTAGAGATYSWTASSGTITDGSGTREITWTAGTAGSATISVTVTNSNGCSCSNTATVTVNDLPSCTITTPPKVCAGVAGYKFSVPTAGAGATYSWTASSGTITDGSGTREITWTAGTAGSATISVTVTNSNGCSCSNTATVTVNALPSCVITASASVCEGSTSNKASVQSAGEGSVYTWTIAGGEITAGSGTREITWTAGASGIVTIYVTVTNGNGCSCSNSVTVDVKALPKAVASSNSPVCEGGDIQLTGSPSGMKTYLWSGPNGFSSNEQNPKISGATLAAAEIYTLAVTSNEGCANTATTNVVVNAKPDCSITAPESVCSESAGNTASVADAGTDAKYTWTITGGEITAGQGTNQITWTAGTDSTALIGVTVENADGCSCTDSATVTVKPKPDCSITAPESVCSESTDNTASVADAGTDAKYTWTITGGEITAGQGTNQITWMAGTDSTALIGVTVENADGCSCTDSATVTVKPKPDCSITAPESVCSESTGNTASVADAGTDAKYTWAITGGEITAGQGTNQITWTAGTDSTALIGVTVENAAGCSCTDSATVTVKPKPDCSITAPESVCSGSTDNAASVASAGEGAKYTWTITGGEITAGQGTNQITWTAGTDSTALIGVTVENAAGCSCTDSATVTVKPKPDCSITALESVCSGSTDNAASVASAGEGAKYTWTITGGEITAGQGTNQITWTAGTDSTALIGVTVENADGCSCTDSATVTVKPKPDCSITAPESVCSESTDNTASVADAGTDAKYTWTITGGEITSGQGTNQITWTAGTDSTALIGVTVENADGCSCTDSATVTVKPKPDCSITAPESVCSESTDNTATVADAGADAKYTWTITGGEITSGQGTNQITWTAGTDSTALIGVTVENADGCSCTDSATVTVNAKPDCSITAPESVCSGSTDNAASVASAGEGAKYTWTITGGEITAGQGTTQITWTAGETGSVLIGITVEQSNGCSCTDSATITINPLPDCTITSPDTVCPDETDNIASVTAEEGATYKWEILSGGVITSGEDQDTMHWTSASSSTAILQVTVTKLGCSAVCTKNVAIKYLPGCLHPGGQYEINGVKYSDLNNNGVRDPGEPGLVGWTINLERPQGTIIDTTTTGPDGSYNFVGLFPVTYFVSEVLQNGWVQTAPEGGYAEVTLSDEVPIQTVNFGNRQKIVPALECVRENPDGSYTAKFTYDNPNGEITIPKGDNNKIEPDPISGSQPDTFSNGINSFTVVFDPSSPITWTLEGSSAVATKDSPRCSIGPTPLVVEKTADKTAVLAGDVVTFTFSVTNTGEVNVDNVQLVDTLSPGFIYQSAQPEPNVIDGNRYTWNLGILEPQQSVQVVLKAQVDPSLCPDNNAQTSEGVIANPNQLSVLASSREPSNLPQIMEALGRNKTKLEVKLDSIRKHRDAFNKTLAAMSSTVKIIDGAKYTLNNYTYVLTGESLSDQFNSSGVLVATEFARPAKDDLMRTEYSATGEILSDFYSFKPTRESLKIEYNKPSSGYRTYTVRYLPTGDTLILVVDSYGNVISREYEKRPGAAILPGPLTNCVQAYGMVAGTPIESNKACVEVIWSCQGPQPVRGITLTKVADRQYASEGDIIKYTYTIKNTGTTTITTLTLKDDKLGWIMLNELVNLGPGAEITRTSNYTVKASDAPILKNTAIAVGYDPAEIVSDPATEVVRIVDACLTKTAYPKVVKPGDYITYNITWKCQPSDGDYILDEYPRGVSFISASPSPDKGDNTWFIGSKGPGTITILVQVAQNIGNTSFDMGQGVTGTGFVNVHNDIRTNPVILTNKATWYRQAKPLYIAYADVNVGKPSTYAGLREYGSGDYASEDVIKYRNLNRSIEWNKSLTATYKPTTFSLPGNRDIDYRTKWIEKAKTKNYATGGSTNEEYTYADRINREAYTKLDENGSTTITDTSFQGVGHIGLLKKDASNNKTWNATDVFESQEDYVGNFQIRQKFDEYGKNAEYEKSVFGTGYVSADRNVGKAQRSYESGTGNYQSEERISTVVNYIAKDIKLEHAPTSYTYTPTVSVASDLKWSEGVWSKSPVTLISEKFSSVESLERDTKVRGLNEMETEANVVGQADFRTVYRSIDKGSPNWNKSLSDEENLRLNPRLLANNTTSNIVDIDERYTGEYSFKRLTRFTGVAKYNRPHITLSKEARVDLANNTFADYKIVIENNGDHTLSPVYILDTFPQGTDYVYSSLRPSELTDEYANWTLLSLGIGDRVVIDLRLNISQPSANIVNRVQAVGAYNDGWVTAGNFSVVQLDWLTCYPIDISATKAVWVDAKDPQVVWYRLDLHNRQNYNMVAFMMDQLPEGMTFLNSSLQPSENNSNQMTWTIMNLAPGETRSIVYRVRALSKGTFVNTAYIDAFAVDGPDSASAKVEARVDLTTGREPGPAVFDRWTLPACFGLNCTQQNFGNDWMACYTCGAGGESRVTVGTPTCLSCFNTGDDNLP